MTVGHNPYRTQVNIHISEHSSGTEEDELSPPRWRARVAGQAKLVGGKGPVTRRALMVFLVFFFWWF